MFKSFKSINDAVMQEIYAYEEQKKLKFEHEFDALCAHISKKYGWTYTIQLYRWIDNFCRKKSKPFDGYTSTVQIVFKDAAGEPVEIDESIAYFFENITRISYVTIMRKYRVFQNDDFVEIRAEVHRFTDCLEKQDS